jgi:hypothetical protein
MVKSNIYTDLSLLLEMLAGMDGLTLFLAIIYSWRRVAKRGALSGVAARAA